MKNFLIDGIWQGPPDGFDVKEWLNEVVAYSGLDEYLQPTGIIRRFQKIERVRRNGRGRGKTIEAIAAEIDRLNDKKTRIIMCENKLCPKCGEELVMCENCENTGCPDCDGYITTRDDVLLCAECGTAIQAEWEKQTENGTKVCGTCAHFKFEDCDGDGWCDKDQMVWHCSYYCK